MPEPAESHLKEKVQKLECLLRAREERIVALETGNAMLYLKLAECQGTLRSSRFESNHFRRLFEFEEGFRKNITKSHKALLKEAQTLKANLEKLRSFVKELPKHFAEDLKKAQDLTHKYGSEGMSNLEEMQTKLMQAELKLDDALLKVATEKNRRMTLHNTLVEIRGNIRVHCRVRPLIVGIDSVDEASLGRIGTPSEQVVNYVDEETLSYVSIKSNGERVMSQKEFEHVYNVKDNQGKVFSDVKPLLTSLLDGYNVCIMAYGQTGSGKTHTMLGSHDVDGEIDSQELNKDEGIIPRAAKEIFSLIAERETKTDSHTVEMSVCEIYNNDVRDLLAPNKTEKLNIMTSSDGDTDIPSLVTRPVKNFGEVMNLVYYGMSRRHEDATMVHAHSSRSHLIVQLQVYTMNQQATATPRVSTPSSEVAPSPPGTPTRSRRNLPQPTNNRAGRSQSPAPKTFTRRGRSKSPAPGSAAARSRSPSPSRSSTGTPPPVCTTVKTKLQLVDLAGSECVGLSGVTGAALRETSFINKSLSALADVLGALAEHRSHIPYRNTRLTHMLQDTIGGNAKLLVMLCVSPAQKFITETLQCIGFGSRARQVARGPAKKRRPTSFVPGSNSSLSIDLSQVNAALRGGNGNLSPRFDPTKRRGSRNFAFPE